MELAVAHGEEYRFTAKYFGASLGYQILELNNNGPDPTWVCSWYFYTLAPGETNYVKSSLGVSSFIPCDGFTVILRYETFSGPPLNVKYQIEYSSECSQRPNPALVTVYGLASGSSALDVMEGAVTASLSPKPYEFVATDCAPATGYFIDAIDSTENNDYPGSLCYWTFYTKHNEEVAIKQEISVSRYIIPGDGYTVIMRYTKASQQQSCDTLPPANKKVLAIRNMLGCDFECTRKDMPVLIIAINYYLWGLW